MIQCFLDILNSEHFNSNFKKNVLKHVRTPNSNIYIKKINKNKINNKYYYIFGLLKEHFGLSTAE